MAFQPLPDKAIAPVIRIPVSGWTVSRIDL